MIVLIEPFCHQEMLILASEKYFRCATLQKSCTEKATENEFSAAAQKDRSREGVDPKCRERVKTCSFAIPAFFPKQLGFLMFLELLSPYFMHQYPGRQGLILTHFYVKKG